MNVGDELPEMHLATVTPRERSRVEQLEHANNVLMSARVTRGLSFCDVLRLVLGEEDGRKRYQDLQKAYGDDLSLYPDDVIQKIDTFH